MVRLPFKNTRLFGLQKRSEKTNTSKTWLVIMQTRLQQPANKQLEYIATLPGDPVQLRLYRGQIRPLRIEVYQRAQCLGYITRQNSQILYDFIKQGNRLRGHIAWVDHDAQEPIGIHVEMQVQ